MSDGPKQVLFLDGIGCNPEGFKPKYMKGLGYALAAPMLPDLDLAAAVAAAEEAFAATPPDVIVGYSRGAAVALLLRDRRTPRLLIAPALHRVPDGRGVGGCVIVLHSATDDGLPLDGVRGHLTRCGLESAEVRVVGEGHTMIDPPALAALAAALRELTRTGGQ